MNCAFVPFPLHYKPLKTLTKAHVHPLKLSEETILTSYSLRYVNCNNVC